MLLSSRTAVADVERKLYHSAEFTRNRDDGKHIRFLESVLDPTRPHVSGLLFRYWLITSWRTTDIHRLLIKRALVTFTNLKQLRFVVTDDEESIASVLPIEHPPFQLELFQWVNSEKAYRDVGIMRFIASQPSLKSLYVRNIKAGVPQISLRNLQNLSDLGGNVGIILPLLPRSVPIDRIHWNFNILQDLSHFPVLSSLRVLSISDLARPLLSDIVGRFENVEVLALPSLHVRCILIYCPESHLVLTSPPCKAQ